MLHALSSRSARTVSALTLRSRRLATHLPAPAAAGTPTSASKTAEEDGGPLRPHLSIEVNPNHGLYGFFRRKEKDGIVSYDTLEHTDPISDKSGRAWTAAELRRKSFKDLHTLWYVVLRERNLLATQQAEGRRVGANEQTLGLWAKAFRCRKTMARIKYVINERRLAYEGAMRMHNEQRDMIMEQEDSVRAEEEARAIEEARKAEDKKENARRRGPTTEDVAAQSLFETIPAASS
ncbi:mitochondrial 39-S ribosomal protein L47 (MRP-L47)-domain-containing protein [Daedaleopsis nitida]|nr:mitochondrial 39-S ribosomal protein L47 (MRP-L47)-domain-containing protein [Daedaleopsis nitida]